MWDKVHKAASLITVVGFGLTVIVLVARAATKSS